MKNARPILGLTMGDPAGIGPEICLRALREPRVLERCTPVLFGDVAVLNRVAQTAGIPGVNCRVVAVSDLNAFFEINEPLVADCKAIDAASIKPGGVSAACGKAGYCYIEDAIKAALAGKIDGVVTAPIHKEALVMAGHPRGLLR